MQSDQSFCCPHEETSHSWLSKMYRLKILIRIFAGCTCAKVRFLMKLKMNMSHLMTKPTKRLVQPANEISLVRVFADCMCLLQPSDYAKRDKHEPLSYWVDVQAGLSLCWLHRSY